MQEPTLNRKMLVLGGVSLALVAIAFVITPLVLSLVTPHFHGVAYDAPREVEDFTLERADGGTLQLSEHRGEVVVLYFGYTLCPDECPATLFDLRRTVERLGDQAEDVTVVFVTIDPANDTAEKLRTYLGLFDPSFVGLTGSQEALQRVYDWFGIDVEAELAEEDRNSQTISHNSNLFLIDRRGRLRVRVHYGTTPDDLADDLRVLLREGG